MKDLAAKTGLGLATISKYVNGGRVKEKNRIVIEQAIEELDYTVNEIARGLKTNQTRTIGVVVPEFTSLFCMTIVSVIEDILRENGYAALVCDCRSDTDIEAETVSFLLHKKVDGIISIPVSQNSRHLDKTVEKGLPVVLIDRYMDGLNCDTVLIDNISAVKSGVDLFLSNGHSEIAVICGPQDVFTSQQRLLGYRQALLERGITPNENYISYGNYSVEGGFAAMKQLIEQNLHNRITALFVTNYEMTLGVIIALNELGLSIPVDLSVVGFDNQELAMVVKPRLTVLSQPLKEMGSQAAAFMMERLANKAPSPPRIARLSTTLIEGESIRKLK